MNNLTQDLTKYVNLMEDSGFKAVYGDVQNKPLLIHLLNLVLPEDVVVKDIVEYRDRERSASTTPVSCITRSWRRVTITIDCVRCI